MRPNLDALFILRLWRLTLNRQTDFPTAFGKRVRRAISCFNIDSHIALVLPQLVE